MDFVERLKKHGGRTVIITGAGISTPSGIPDFRSKDGIYSRYDPEELFGLDNFVKNPAYFYAFAKENLFTMANAEPNVIHVMIERLEALGLINGVVTQNIDTLHSKAGSVKLAEVHGNVSNGRCMRCGRGYALARMAERAAKSAKGFPRCECGGLVKPDIVFFGEPLPETELRKAYGFLEDATMVAAMGTSLTVYPVAAFPYEVLRKSGELVIANAGRTGLDSLADERYLMPLEEFSAGVLSRLSSPEGL